MVPTDVKVKLTARETKGSISLNNNLYQGRPQLDFM